MRRYFLGMGIAIAMIMEVPAVGYTQSTNVRSGNFWLPLCEADPSIECLALLVGFGGGSEMMEVLTGQTFICTPAGFNNGQGRRVLVKYLRDHPEQLHENIEVLVAKAFLAAFPCPKKAVANPPPRRK